MFTITNYVVVVRTENRSVNAVSIGSGDAPYIHVPESHCIVTKGLYGFEEHENNGQQVCVLRSFRG